jgi:hypothetical protein
MIGWLRAPDLASEQKPLQIIPYLGRIFIGPVPDNKLPGYDHWSLRDGASFSRRQTLCQLTYEQSVKIA